MEMMANAGTPPNSARFTLIGELSTRSVEFRVRWARHDVKYHRHANLCGGGAGPGEQLSPCFFSCRRAA